jgi:hypothetical protein
MYTQLAVNWDVFVLVYLSFLLFFVFVFGYAPFEEGRAYCFAAVCRLVGPPAVSVHFLCTGCRHIEMKFGI